MALQGVLKEMTLGKAGASAGHAAKGQFGPKKEGEIFGRRIGGQNCVHAFRPGINQKISRSGNYKRDIRIPTHGKCRRKIFEYRFPIHSIATFER